VARLEFAPSDEFADQARAAFAVHERRIREQLPGVEVRHRGGTSVAGVLTSGDVDVHVRTGKDAFESALALLSAIYEPFHEDAWRPGESAFFHAPDSSPEVEIALTVIGSRDDLHHGEAWDRIATDPGLIERYNELKRRCEGGDRGDYDAAKRAFFYENF